MADISAQLSQWSFEKPTTRTERSSSDSSASSPNLRDDASDTLRIDTSASQETNIAYRKESSIVLQERYNSSEEDLTAGSGSDSEYDYDDVVVHDVVKECKARTMSVSRWDKGKSCDMAITVSYAFAGRPKVVELDCRSPMTDRPTMQQRSTSLAGFTFASVDKSSKLAETQRMSMPLTATTRFISSSASNTRTPSPSPSTDFESRRPSTSHGASALHQAVTDSTTSSFKTAPSSRSISPSTSEAPRRPSTSTADNSASARSSVYIPSRSRIDLHKLHTSQSSYRQSQFAPMAPQSPAMSFLSSDPYETSTTNSSSPIIKKPAAHKRLRSISMKLALAKIAISPSKKQYDARLTGKGPATPSTPVTPQTAPLDRPAASASPNKLRRASTILRPKSRQSDLTRMSTAEPPPPVPMMPATSIQQKRSTRMVARGADEREPTLVIPPCPEGEDTDPMSSVKLRALRKRKSLMDFMDSLA